MERTLASRGEAQTRPVRHRGTNRDVVRVMHLGMSSRKESGRRAGAVLGVALLGVLGTTLLADDLAVARPRPADPVRMDATAVAARPPAPVVEPLALDASPLPDVAPFVAPIDIRPPEIRTPELDCTPVAESGYRRGKKTPIMVVTIDREPIERATANAYWAMREAAASDGLELMIFSAFRSPAQQAYFYGCYRTCACNSCAPAAKPGYSNHQMGRAVDIAMWPGVHEWLVANAKRFGFVATVKSEPWHWELRRGAKGPESPVCPAK